MGWIRQPKDLEEVIMFDFNADSEISSIAVTSEYEGNSFEHAVSTIQDARMVRDLKIANSGENVKIVVRMADGSTKEVD